MKISVCLMVKNEETFLEACLKSVQSIADEIVIVDTGSTDGTLQIAGRFADKLISIPFNGHYGAMRNEVIARAEAPWILFMDADEEFPPQEVEKIRRLVESAPDDVAAFRFLRYNFFANGGWYSTKVIKLFRNHPEIRYRKAISETIEPDINRIGMKIMDVPIIQNHFGHCRNRIARDRKARNYMELMRKQLEETPDDAVMIGYIGLNLRLFGEFDSALEATRRAIQMNPSSPTIHSFHAHVLRSMGRNEEALAHYQEAARLRPADALISNMVGVMLMTLHRLEEARDIFEQAYHRDPHMIHILINKGLIHEFQQQYTEAYHCYKTVADANSGFMRDDWRGRVECDPYRSFYYETVMQYAGLKYHYHFVKNQMGGRK